MAQSPETFDPLEEQAASNADTAVKIRLENIISSYKNSVDVLAEPIQNAMDAIVRADDDGRYDGEDDPSLTVTIDTDEDTIAVEDNGRGFPLDELKDYIAPEGTNKRSLFTSGKVRGHKGVGLTFLAYGFNYFEVEAKAGGEPYRLTLKEGRDWVNGDDIDASTRPQAQIDRLDEDDLKLEGDRGTRVEVHADEASQPSQLSRAFNSAKMTQTILETQTAIGVLPPRDETHPSVDVELMYVNGDRENHPVDDSYRFPHQKLNDDLDDGESKLKTIDIDGYDYQEDDEQATEGVLPEDQSAYHGVYRSFDADDIADRITDDHTGEELQTPDEVKEYIREHELVTYVLYTYSNEYRKELKERWDVRGTRKFHSPGVRIGTDGMISTWHRPSDLSYSAPRESRLWFVYHFQDVRPDTGRKDFPTEVHDVVDQTEQFLHKSVVTDGKHFLRPTPSNKSEVNSIAPLEKALGKDDISSSETQDFGDLPQVKEPGEEQDAVAIFNQMIGMGIFRCYDPHYFSMRDDYDGFLKYNPDAVPSELRDVLPGSSDVSATDLNITLEFKQKGVDIIDHIVNETREWSEMDLLVCWELGGTDDTGDDSIKAQKEWGGDTITFRVPTQQEDRRYAGVTHIAHLASKGNVPLHTISLKDVIEKLNGGN